MINRIYVQFLMIALVLALGACMQDEYDVSIDKTGTIKVKVVDKDGNAIGNQQVFLFSDYSVGRGTSPIIEELKTSGTVLDKTTTDENGEIDFGRFLEGDYAVAFDYLAGNDYYSVVQPIHVIAGRAESTDVSLGNFRNDLTVDVVDDIDGNPYAGLEVMLVWEEYINDSKVNEYQDAKSLASAIGITDEQGRVVLNVPVGNYFLYIYESEEEKNNPAYLQINRGVDLFDLRELTKSI